MDHVSQVGATSAAAGAPVEGPDLTGQTLGDFRVLRRLGQGGMGQVYLAEQLSLKRKVALKILRPDLAANPTALKRFQAEAEAVARINHANIVQVYAIGTANGQHYMALEYVDGRNLRDYLAKKGPPDVLPAVSIMRQVAAALQRASEQGIVHRDIKPENILITRQGEVKVTDFGLSRCFAGDRLPMNLTQSGVTMGTPLYMSPEQVQGKDIDPRSDIYSLGVTSYHLLSGQPPYRGQSAFDVAVQHVHGEPEPLSAMRPDLPPELTAIIHKMMAKDPAQRYQTGRELLLDLTRLREMLSGGPNEATGGASGHIAVPLATSSVRLPVLSNSGSTALAAATPRRWRWLIVALVLALILGSALSLLRHGIARFPWSAEPVAPRAVVQPDPAQTHEEQLWIKVRQPFTVDDPQQLRAALEARIDLALFYLEHRRLQQAQQFAVEELIDNPSRIEAFRTLGFLTQAMVLAFQDQAEKSNLEMLKLMGPRGRESFWRGDEHQWLFHHAALRAMLAEALTHNARNLGSDLPPPLERLRRIPYNRRPMP
ncbi:MAG: protein kinase domain-containing protein [Gemmataceae bacterium]